MGNHLKKAFVTFSKLTETVRAQYGYGAFSYLQFFYYSFLSLNNFLIFEYDLSGTLPKSNIDFFFQVMTPSPEELDRLRADQSLPREFYQDTIDAVKTCFVALHGYELAYIHWLYFPGDPSRFLILKNGAVEINYFITLPKFRGHRLSERMISHTLAELKKAGHKKVFVVTHAHNTPAIKSLRSARFKRIGQIRALGPFNKKFQI